MSIAGRLELDHLKVPSNSNHSMITTMKSFFLSEIIVSFPSQKMFCYRKLSETITLDIVALQGTMKMTIS